MKLLKYMIPVIVFISLFGAAVCANAADELVAFVKPPNGSTVSGDSVVITISFNSTDSNPVSKVKVFLDGKAITERLYEKPSAVGQSSFMWDTTLTPNGMHQLDTQIFSGSKYLGMAGCCVTVANKEYDIQPPKIDIISPKSGEKVSGVTTILVAASDENGDPLVSIYVDDKFRAAGNVKPYSYEWDTTKQSNGPHTIDASGVDSSDNTARANTVKVVISNPVKVALIDDAAKSNNTTAADSSDIVAKTNETKAVPSGSSTVRGEGTSARTENSSTAASEALDFGNVPASKSTDSSKKPLVLTASIPKPAPVEKPKDVKASASGSEAPLMAMNASPSDGFARAPEVKTGVTAGSECVAPAVTVAKVPVVTATEKPIKAGPEICSDSGRVDVSVSPASSCEYGHDVKPVLVAKAVSVEPSTVIQKPVVTSKPVTVASVVSAASTAVEKSKPSYNSYTVKEGDNVWSLSRQFGVSMDSIIVASNLDDPSKLQIGDKLIIPSGETMVVLRPIIERNGGTMEWNGEKKTVKAVCSDKVVELKIGSSNAKVNNKDITMKKAPEIVDGRTTVEKSFASEVLD